MSHVRNYCEADYEALVTLYSDGSTFGGEYDAARDSIQKIRKVTDGDPEAVLVYEQDGVLLGSISLIEDGRVAWLFRFSVKRTPTQDVVADALYQHAVGILRSRGHTQVLVYSDPQNEHLNTRYHNLQMNEGGLFRCFWKEIG